jgi:acetolactate synthase-1/2/3 large subunit
MTEARASTGGQLVVSTLERMGTDTVFGIPGQHALGLFDALQGSGIRHITSRVENNAAFSADGFARESGKVGVLFLSTGPGALTALAGLQEAHASSVPVLVISSQVPRAGLFGARKGMLHQLDDQGDAARQVAKHTRLVLSAADIPRAVTDAWAAATAHPQGPAWVEIPQDVLEELASPESDIRIPDAHRPQADPTLLDRAGGMLNGARSVAIVAGGGVRRSGAEAELLRVAELLDAPVVTSPGGHGAFPWRHPLSLQGWVEDRHVTEVLENAEALVAVGTSLGEVTSNYYTLSPRGRTIQIDAESRVLGSNHPVLGIPADAKLALAALAERLGPGSPSRARESRDRVAAALARVAQRLAEQDLDHELRFMAALREGVPEDASTHWDMTIAGYWAWAMWDRGTGSFESAQGAGGLGFALPAALGAAAASGRRTVAVSGDGGAMYGVAELASLAQHRLPVTWVVVDDGGYGILREYMTARFGRATATDLSRPDFRRLASAFGISASVADVPDLAPVLRRATAGHEPHLVVVPTRLRMFEPTHLRS